MFVILVSTSVGLGGHQSSKIFDLVVGSLPHLSEPERRRVIVT